MWEWLGSNFDKIGSIGKLVGGAGEAYGAIQQSKYAKDILNLQKDNINRQNAKEDLAQSNLDTAINNVYGTKKKNNNTSLVPQFDLGA